MEKKFLAIILSGVTFMIGIITTGIMALHLNRASIQRSENAFHNMMRVFDEDMQSSPGNEDFDANLHISLQSAINNPKESFITIETVSTEFITKFDNDPARLKFNTFNFTDMDTIKYKIISKENAISKDLSTSYMRLCTFNQQDFNDIENKKEITNYTKQSSDEALELIMNWGENELIKRKHLYESAKQVTSFVEILSNEIKNKFILNGIMISENLQKIISDSNVINKKTNLYNTYIEDTNKALFVFKKEFDKILSDINDINYNHISIFKMIEYNNIYLNEINTKKRNSKKKFISAIYLIENLKNGPTSHFKTHSENILTVFNKMENIMMKVKTVFLKLEIIKQHMKFNKKINIEQILPISKHVNMLDIYKCYINYNREAINSIKNIIEIPKNCISNKLNENLDENSSSKRNISNLKPKAREEYNKLQKFINKLPVYPNTDLNEYRQTFYIFGNNICFSYLKYEKQRNLIQKVGNNEIQIIDCEPLIEEDPNFNIEKFIELFINTD
ncbi:hypothetical protein TCON_1080 [Astathelohania contejeani]|uniref:Uncharacterized protein n=1 Tax=Astathelohania contejeani TaxID=164912 RepID=A0ABQ7HZT2_9MICR|nr:hypothetical protein TCON_1080 [Thelohania contejeani]